MEGITGLVGVVVGGIITTWSAWWMRRRERRAELARENRRDVYEPALAALHGMRRVLEVEGPPTAIADTAPADGVVTLTGDVVLDISWWTTAVETGAHLRIAPSVRDTLAHVSRACRVYDQEHRRAIDKGRRLLFDFMKRAHVTDAIVPDQVIALRYRSFSAGVGRYVIRGEVAKGELLSALRNLLYDKEAVVESAARALEDMRCLHDVRAAASDLNVRVTDAIDKVQTHIDAILKGHEVRDETV